MRAYMYIYVYHHETLHVGERVHDARTFRKPPIYIYTYITMHIRGREYVHIQTHYCTPEHEEKISLTNFLCVYLFELSSLRPLLLLR